MVLQLEVLVLISQQLDNEKIQVLHFPQQYNSRKFNHNNKSTWIIGTILIIFPWNIPSPAKKRKKGDISGDPFEKWKQYHCICVLTLSYEHWASPTISSKRICLQARRHGFDPWVRKIHWERKWQPQYSCWKIPWTEQCGVLQSTGWQTAGHNWATEHAEAHLHSTNVKVYHLVTSFIGLNWGHMMCAWCLMESEELSKHVPEMKLFEHVPAEEINSPPGKSTAVMIIPNSTATHKTSASLSQPSNCLFSYRAGTLMFYRNTPFLIKHSINHSSKGLKKAQLYIQVSQK